MSPREAGPPAPVRLDLNIAPFLNEEAVRRALDRAAPRDLAMYPEPGVPRLEAAIASRVGISADRVLVGNGSDELLDLAMRALVPPSGRVGVVQPTFGMYDHFARACGVSLARVPARGRLPVRELSDLRADAYFLPSPNNPTGTLFSRGDVSALAAAVPVPVLVDEAYAEFARQDLRDLARNLANVLVTRTFSKAYGLPGIRVGYLLGPGSLVSRVRALRTPYNLSAWSERAALAALEDGAFVERTVAYVERERARLHDALRDAGWPVWPSSASFLLVGPLRRATEIREGLLSRGVVVKPVDWPGGEQGGCLRISVGTSDQDDRLLEALGEVARWRE